MEKLFGSYIITSGSRDLTNCGVADEAEARNVFSTFTFSSLNRDRIQLAIEILAAFCQLMKNVPFERSKFYSRMQEAGES